MANCSILFTSAETAKKMFKPMQCNDRLANPQRRSPSALIDSGSWGGCHLNPPRHNGPSRSSPAKFGNGKKTVDKGGGRGAGCRKFQVDCDVGAILTMNCSAPGGLLLISFIRAPRTLEKHCPFIHRSISWRKYTKKTVVHK